jgi:hypothetical protein
VVGTHWWHVEGSASRIADGVNLRTGTLQDINGSGTAVGSSLSPQDVAYCVKLPGGTVTELPGRRAFADINDKGEIAGATFDAGGVPHPAVWPAGTCP